VSKLLVLQLDPSDPPARIGDWLRAAGLALHIVALDAGEPVPSLAGYDGLLVLGGFMSAWQDDIAPFLPDVRALIREAVTGEVPTLGICLGHQLLAAATGGQVRRRPDGPEIGALLVAKRGAASSDPLFATLPITPDVLQWHFDEVSALPPGAIHLASSPESEYQAFRIGRLAWGIQFHIETTPEIIQAWAEDRDEALDDYDMDTIVARAKAVHEDIAEVWPAFAVAFADVVRAPAAVPPPRGVATSSAAPVTDPAAIRAALAAEITASRTPLPIPGLRREDD
jgi:GMP synthase-like glutamine amidotransferase